MILGFEEETKDLSPIETQALNYVIMMLENSVGEKNAINNRYIQEYLKRIGYNIGPARIRKIINQIRCKGYILNLVATSKGYYIATSRAQALDYLESLNGRIKAIEQIKRSIKPEVL